MITLRFGTSTNGLAGAYHPPTRPPLANAEPESTHPVCCGWRAVRSVSGSHWAKSALFLEHYINRSPLSPRRSVSLALSRRNEEVEFCAVSNVSCSFSGAAAAAAAAAAGEAVAAAAAAGDTHISLLLFHHTYTTDICSVGDLTLECYEGKSLIFGSSVSLPREAQTSY